MADASNSVHSVYGLLAEFEHPEDLLHAAEKVRLAGYSSWDTFTPFQVHGLDDAMGVRRTILPWLVFGAGAFGCGIAILFQWWTNAVDYPFLISGKPEWSLPANIPVAFEVTILCAAIVAVVGMLWLNNLPRLHHPLFRSERFRRATTDRFFLAIEASDPLFDEVATRKLLESTKPSAVECIEDTT